MNLDALLACDLADEDCCGSPTDSWLALLEESDPAYPCEDEAADAADDEEQKRRAAALEALSRGRTDDAVFARVAVRPRAASRRTVAADEDAPPSSGLEAALTAPPEAAAADDGDVAGGEGILVYLPTGAQVDLALAEAPRPRGNVAEAVSGGALR